AGEGNIPVHTDDPDRVAADDDLVIRVVPEHCQSADPRIERGGYGPGLPRFGRLDGESRAGVGNKDGRNFPLSRRGVVVRSTRGTSQRVMSWPTEKQLADILLNPGGFEDVPTFCAAGLWLRSVKVLRSLAVLKPFVVGTA